MLIWGRAGAGSVAGSAPKREPMVSTSSPASATTPDPSATATISPGSRGARRRSPTISAIDASATATAAGLTVSRAAHSTGSLSMKSAGRWSMDRPRKSLIWLVAMTMAMPMVKPLTTGSGTKAISRPARK